MGISRNSDYNGMRQEGASYTQRTIANGRRESAAKAFLTPVRNQANLDVRTHAHATGLVFDGKRCAGVRYNKGGRGGTPFQVTAKREVILASGVINSPQLLQL